MTTFTEVHTDTFLPDRSQPMPRTTKATADTLERQAAADSKLGDLDEQGLERIPEFEAEHTNGHVPEGVRPSERCGTPSPLGMGCTFRDEHAGRHSWQPTQDEAPDLIEPTQPALPGTPEPEFNEYSVPVESAFEGKDFMSAPGLRAIAEAWISETEELAHLRGIQIRYFWKRRGGLKGGNPRLGNLQRPTGLAAYSLGKPEFCLWLAADHCLELRLTHEQLRSAVLHELCKAAVDPDDHSAYRVVGPDAEVFALELRKVGLWSLDLQEVGAHIKQLALLDTLQVPALDQGHDADEGDEGEADE